MSDEAGALWGGRFKEGMAREMVPLNLSLDVDKRLWREDIQGSVAWARAIGKAGVLTDKEVGDILGGLDNVVQRIEKHGLSEAAEEDIHSV
ncbi:MAG TPA: hypothetical protein DCS75_05225, partial [Gemmatimonadetes bacterium]|nr:hypothetical protein [Gemmatimonadota bacterium]